MEDDAEKQLKKIIRLHVIKFLIIGNVLKKYPYSRGKAQMRHLKVVDAVSKVRLHLPCSIAASLL